MADWFPLPEQIKKNPYYRGSAPDYPNVDKGVKAVGGAAKSLGEWMSRPADLSRMPGSQLPSVDNRLPKATVPPVPPVADSNFAVPAFTPRAPKKNPLGFLGGAPASGPTPTSSEVATENFNYSLGSAFPPPQAHVEQADGNQQSQALSAALQANPPTRTLVDAWAGGSQPYAPVFAGDSAATGRMAKAQTLDGWKTERPEYTTPYFDAQGKEIASITGPDQRVGGGTVSAPDQGNGGTVEGNAAAINRQAEALRSLREARNPGITTGDIGQVQAPKPIDPWARPGDSFGDSQRREQEYASLLSAIQSDRGWGSAKRNQSRAAAAQAMIEPGVALARTTAEQQGSKDNLAAHLAATAASRYNTDADLTQRMLAAQRQAGLDSRQAGMDNARLALDQRKQHLNELTQTNNRAKGEYDLQREADLAKLWESIKALPAGDPRAKALSDQYMLLKRGMEPKQDLISQL